MAPVTARLRRQVRTEFGPHADAVLAMLARVPEQVPGGGNQYAERLQAALVLGAGGDVHVVARRVVTAVTDWRDLLVGTGLAGTGWRDVRAAQLDPPRRRWPFRRRGGPA